MMFVYAVAGAIGGLVKSLVEQKGRISLPGYETAADGTKYIHLGFVMNIIIGGAVSFYLSQDPVGAFTEGIASVFIVEKILETTPAVNPKQEQPSQPIGK